MNEGKFQYCGSVLVTRHDVTLAEVHHAVSHKQFFYDLNARIRWFGYAHGLRQIDIGRVDTPELQDMMRIERRFKIYWLPDEQMRAVPGWDADGAPCWDYPEPRKEM